MAPNNGRRRLPEKGRIAAAPFCREPGELLARLFELYRRFEVSFDDIISVVSNPSRYATRSLEMFRKPNEEVSKPL